MVVGYGPIAFTNQSTGGFVPLWISGRIVYCCNVSMTTMMMIVNE